MDSLQKQNKIKRLNQKLLKKELEEIKGNLVSIWWVTETQARAERITYMEEIGALIRKREDPRDQYPWCVFEVHAEKLDTVMEHNHQAY